MQSLPGARVSDRLAGGPTRPSTLAGTGGDGDASLDCLALAKGVLRSRLSDPTVVVALLAFVAVVAYRLGRRSRSGAYRVEDLERMLRLLDRR